MFTATRLQAATYLLGVCLFSISILVFLNSTISFVVTVIIKEHDRVGNAVGTLGFADELVALIACPVWGMLSDRIGVRTVCVIGYSIVGCALLLLVQAKNIYPQLLLARLFFSIGGAATSTMVTAILPSMTAASPPAQTVTPQINPGHTHDRTMSPSVSSELTITPARLQSQQPRSSLSPGKPFEGSSPTRLAGLVGLFTGCGALLALGVFLRLPAQFQDLGIEPGQALADTYYLVGGLALLVGSTCFIGLRRLNGEEEKGWHAVVQREKVKDGSSGGRRSLAYWKLLVRSISLGLNNPLIGLGYLGGFVARASSVGISLFIPLFVNAYFTSHGLCKINTVAGPRDMKSQCPKAYTVAAELTGVSELVALLSAPLIGFLADKYRRFHLPLLVANVAGIAGYVGFATLGGPAPSEEHGNPWIFIIVALIGIGQMGTIVCSLGLLGRGILGLEKGTTGLESTVSNCSNGTGQNGSEPSTANGYRSISDHPEESMHDSPASRLVQGQSWDQADENTGLLPIGTREDHSLIHLKGSIAGVYSLAGGAGILLLTKLGGYLFDAASSSAPFYMLATFNALLLVVAVVCGIREAVTGRSQHEEIEA